MALSTIYVTASQDLLTNGAPSPSVSFDSVQEFTPRFSSVVTKFPLSDKSEASAHRIKNNVVINVSGYISTVPLIAYEGNLVGYTELSERPQSAYNVFKSWYEEGIPLIAVNEFDVFDQLILKDFTPVSEGSDSILVNLMFEQVRRSTYRRVTLIQNMDSVKTLDADPNRGKTDGKKEPTERESQTYRLLDDTGEFLNQFQFPQPSEG